MGRVVVYGGSLQHPSSGSALLIISLIKTSNHSHSVVAEYALDAMTINPVAHGSERERHWKLRSRTKHRLWLGIHRLRTLKLYDEAETVHLSIVVSKINITESICKYSCLQYCMMPELTLEEMLRKHKQEQKDLQARVTQKKKSATKKTRKGVNDECVELERQLKVKHDSEIGMLTPAKKALTNDADGAVGEGLNQLSLSDTSNGTAHMSPSEPMGQDNGTASLQVGSSTSEPAKKPNRHKARLARRAAEQEAAAEQAAKEAQELPDLRAQESEAMQQDFSKRGLKEHAIRSDGHCLYAAIADQLKTNGCDLVPIVTLTGLNLDGLNSNKAYQATRSVAAAYMEANIDDFLPFLEEPLETYAQTIRETGEWGGHLELLALARAYCVNIKILQWNRGVETIECGSETENRPLWLAYYRHSHGLGEHYNSLRQPDP